MFIDNEEEINDVPETSLEENEIETNTSEEVEKVQETTEEVVQPSEEDIEKQIEEQNKCLSSGNMYSQVKSEVYKNIAIGAVGYTAQDTVRNLLNQYTHFNEGITIQCIPIYYLEPNTRIRVDDKTTNIHGDFMIKSISLPLGTGLMSITATRIRGLAETL